MIAPDRYRVLVALAASTYDLTHKRLTAEERMFLTATREQGENSLAPLLDTDLRVIDQELHYLRIGVAA